MSCPIRLEAQVGEDLHEVTRADSGTISIGREPENSVQVDSDALSRRHGYLFNAGSQWIFCDLDSTNGSWVNSVKVEPGQLRLLRSGDVLQLADFVVRYFENLDAGSGTSVRLNRSLIVFFNNQFHQEIDLSAEGSRLVIGGPEADLEIDGESSDRPQLVVAVHSGLIEVTASRGGIPVSVNGMAIAGESAVADRDDIVVGPYRIIVNDEARASAHVQAQQEMAVESAPERSASFIARDMRPSEDDWDRPAKHGGKNFVFGTPPVDEDVTGTISVRKEDFSSYAGLPHRYSTTMQQIDQGSAVADRLL
ncbi:MAG: FHA domain-containing protein, partial [Bdellovibrionales bacterium]|nr:FHA domain-containing protein [Bdellovibrionales bacterium]